MPTESGQVTRAEDLSSSLKFSARQSAQSSVTVDPKNLRESPVATPRRGQEMLLLLLFAVLAAVAAFLLFKFATVVDGITPISFLSPTLLL